MKHSKEGSWKKSTQNKAQEEPTIIPEDEPVSKPHEVNNIFYYAALAYKQNRTLYTDTTVTLPAMLLNGHRYQYYFIAYDYDTTYIFAIPIKDAIDDSIIEVFNQVFTQFLKEKGLKPIFNVTDSM